VNEFWNNLSDLGQLAVGLGTILGIVGMFKVFGWALEKIDGE
jgi:hypothetical protein